MRMRVNVAVEKTFPGLLVCFEKLKKAVSKPRAKSIAKKLA